MLQVSREDLQRIMDEVDPDGSGEIDYDGEAGWLLFYHNYCLDLSYDLDRTACEHICSWTGVVSPIVLQR